MLVSIFIMDKKTIDSKLIYEIADEIKYNCEKETGFVEGGYRVYINCYIKSLAEAGYETKGLFKKIETVYIDKLFPKKLVDFNNSETFNNFREDFNTYVKPKIREMDVMRAKSKERAFTKVVCHA